MKYVRPKTIVSGFLTYIPGPAGIILSRGTGGTSGARYCYSVWLRHLAMIQAAGLGVVPGKVAELGPGDSLGMGLSALLSGAEKYFAMDAVPYAAGDTNLKIFDELVELFRKREPIPGDDEHTDIWPRPENRGFPSDILTDDLLRNSLDESRVASIRAELADFDNGKNLFVKYYAPWDNSEIIEGGSVDMIFSQAVLEHVDELEKTYRTLGKWLKPGGLMSHQIDLSAHVFSPVWNGHWTFSDITWKIIRGRRHFALNREPLSRHLELLEKNGFKVVRLIEIAAKNNISRNELAPRFRNLSDEDLSTRGAYILARKAGLRIKQ